MDMAREIMAEQSAWAYMLDNTRWFGTIQAIAQYNGGIRSTKSTGLGALPFWNYSNKMTVGRNSFGNTTAYDLDSYQLGLGDTINSGLISLSPQVYSAGINFFLFTGPHETKPGFFGKINIPCCTLSIDPQFKEINQVIGQTYAKGEMNTASLNAALAFPIYTTIAQAFAGGAIAGSPTGSAFKGLEFGIIDSKQTSLLRFGDIDLAIGYNFLVNDRSHIGAGIRLSCPTGNKPTAIYVLEPIVGNGGHWGIGGEIMGHTIIWEGHDDKSIEFWFDGQAQHLFKSMQFRSFDLLQNGPGSKYLLVKDLSPDGKTSQQLIQPFINLSSLRVFSTVGIVFDAALLLQMVYHNWQLGIGYNFAGKSTESLALLDKLAIGRYIVNGQQPNESAATATLLGDPSAKINAAMPSAQGAGVLGSYAINIQGNSALNIQDAQLVGGCSSKVFLQSVYSWLHTDYCPLIAAQLSIEFSQSNNNALSQWGIGLRGGFSF